VDDGADSRWVPSGDTLGSGQQRRGRGAPASTRAATRAAAAPVPCPRGEAKKRSGRIYGDQKKDWREESLSTPSLSKNLRGGFQNNAPPTLVRINPWGPGLGVEAGGAVGVAAGEGDGVGEALGARHTVPTHGHPAAGWVADAPLGERTQARNMSKRRKTNSLGTSGRQEN